MRQDIEKSKLIIKKLAEENQLELVILFGSQAKGKTHSKSDTDIAFRSQFPMRPLEIAKMQMDFSLNLKIKDIEMVDLRGASPLLLKQIAKYSVALFEKEPSAYNRFKMYAYKRYMEAGPLLKLRRLQFNNFLKTHAG